MKRNLKIKESKWKQAGWDLVDIRLEYKVSNTQTSLDETYAFFFPLAGAISDDRITNTRVTERTNRRAMAISSEHWGSVEFSIAVLKVTNKWSRVWSKTTNI